MPIATVIKGYLDKSGGKVSASRKEIERRFYALDWRYQKQILFAFLRSGKTDREWAYSKLYAIWDKCFIPVLQELWEQYHEKDLAWLIIRFFPIDYLKKEFENLSEGRNYYFLYQRLCDDKDFVLDKTRLNEADLLAVKYSLTESVTDDDIKDLFYLLIYKLCKGEYHFKVRNVLDYTYQLGGLWMTLDFRLHPGQPLLAIFTSSLVNNMISVISEGYYKPLLFENIQEWMFQVSNSFATEYGDLDEYDGPDREDYVREKIKEHCLKYIPAEYKDLWDGLDLTNQQQLLDILDKRHEEHILSKEK